MEHTSIEDPAYHAAVVDLLGVLAYGELTAFIRMAVDSDLAPTLHLKSAMAGLANTEYVQYSVLVDHMRACGIDPDAAMAPFVVPFAAYHERTNPRAGSRGWSRPTSVTASPRTSTGRCPSSSTTTPAR